MATEKQPTKPTKTATEILRHEEAARKEIVKQIGAIEDLRQWLEEMGAPLSLRDAAHECQKFARSQHYVIHQRIQWMTEAKRSDFTL